MATFNGTSGADSIDGSTSNDTISGLGGNDQLFGGEGFGDEVGKDTIYGGNGDDLIGGAGDHDVLYGGDGDDTLGGDNGNDVLYGGAGGDTLDGSLGNDDIHADQNDGLELVYAGDGADEIWFGPGEGYNAHLGGADGDRDTVHCSATAVCDFWDIQESTGAAGDRIDWQISGAALDAAGNHDGAIGVSDSTPDYIVAYTASGGGVLSITDTNDGDFIAFHGIGTTAFDDMVT